MLNLPADRSFIPLIWTFLICSQALNLREQFVAQAVWYDAKNWHWMFLACVLLLKLQYSLATAISLFSSKMLAYHRQPITWPNHAIYRGTWHQPKSPDNCWVPKHTLLLIEIVHVNLLYTKVWSILKRAVIIILSWPA